MPIAQTRTNREEVLEVLAERIHVMRVVPNVLDRSYFPDDSTGQRYVRPGLILAQESTTNKFVPWNTSALYGTGSDTAIGILDTFQDATQEDPPISPVFHGKVIEAHAYVHGVNFGTAIPAGVKTDLQMIEWV